MLGDEGMLLESMQEILERPEYFNLKLFLIFFSQLLAVFLGLIHKKNN